MRYKLLRALFGLLVGAVVGVGLAFLAAYFWYFLAPNTDYFRARGFPVYMAFGAGISLAVSAMAARGAGFDGWPFRILGVVSAAATGALLALSSLDGRAWSGAGLPPAATALAWVGLPFALGGCVSLIGARN